MRNKMIKMKSKYVCMNIKLVFFQQQSWEKSQCIHLYNSTLIIYSNRKLATIKSLLLKVCLYMLFLNSFDVFDVVFFYYKISQ